MNYAVDGKHRDIKEVVREFLQSKGLSVQPIFLTFLAEQPPELSTRSFSPRRSLRESAKERKATASLRLMSRNKRSRAQCLVICDRIQLLP